MDSSGEIMKEAKELIMNEAKAEIWKKKYEECEKTLERVKVLSKKVICDFEELQRKYQENLKQHEKLKEEHKRKEQTLERFQALSVGVVEEYETLSTKYEIESQAKDEVMEKASKWYHENRALKRKSAMLMQKVMGMDNVDLAQLAEIEAAEFDLHKDTDYQETTEHFNQTINKLKDEVAVIRKELRELQEEKMTIANEKDELTKLYKAEMSDHEATKEKLRYYETTLNQMNRVSVLAVQEYDDLYSRYCYEAEKAKQISEQATLVSRERDALAEKNVMLLAGTSPDERLNEALNEIEDLKKQLQERQDQHTLEMEKLKCQVQEEISDELQLPLQKKIDCLEKCLEEVEERAVTAERKAEMLQHRVQEMERQLQQQQRSVPLPPPPPPPPLPSPSSRNPLRSLIALIGAKKKLSPTTTKKRKSDVPEDEHHKAMREMIESIKRGDVKLKPVKKEEKISSDEDDASQSAINEMKKILTSLKKQKENNGDEESQLPSTTSSEQEGELYKIFEQRHKKSSYIGKAVSTSSSSQDISSEDGEEEVRRSFVKKSLTNITSNEDVSEGSCKHSSDIESVNSKEDLTSNSMAREKSTASIDSISKDNEAGPDISVEDNENSKCKEYLV